MPKNLRSLVRTAVIILQLGGVHADAQSSLFTVGGTFPVTSGSASSGVASATMVTADFNHDGKADLAVLNTNNYTLTVLVGDGTGKFTPAPSSPISAFGTLAVGTGDFNGDGIPDLAVTGLAGTQVLLGDGAGGFTKAGGITGAYSNYGGQVLSVADFNGDGKLDLATGGNTQGAVFLGDGTGAFTFAAFVGIDHQMYDMVAGDFNGDGYMDLAMIGYADTISIDLGPFTTTGYTQAYSQSGDSQYDFGLSAATGAFGGGARSDLLTFRSFGGINFYPQVWYWTGNPPSAQPTFNFLPMSSVPAAPSFTVVADFNGDGNLDWAGANPSSGTVTVAFGLGDGSFTQAPGSPFALGGSPFTLAAADFNGDGKTDLAVDTGSQVVILLNGGGSLQQTIQFGSLSTQTYSTLPITISATSSSGLPVSFTSSTPTVCGVSGTTVTLVGAGTCTIVATQPGNSTYASAPPVTQSFTVNKAPQTITFAQISPQTVGFTSFPLAATASSGLAVTYAAQPSSVCVLDGTLMQSYGVGTCTVTASQPGNYAYLAAPSVTQSFTVSARTQTITFNAIPPQDVGVTVSLFASSSASLPITFTSNTVSVCTIVSQSFAVTASAGTCSITATQAGNADYTPATPVTQTFTISLASQTINFAPLPNQQSVGTGIGASATASSGLPVTLVSNAPSVCTVSGQDITLVAVGTCSITASQAGNSTYAAAPAVTQSVAVTSAALKSQTITFGALSNQTLGSGSIAISATASSGLPVTFFSGTPGVCTVSGNTVTLVAAGTCTITATQAGNSTYNAAPTVNQSFAVLPAAPAAQTITFAALPNVALGVAPFTVTASASSGLPVVITSSTTSVCAVSGNTVTILASGTCTLTATQAGNVSYASAAAVTQSFTVTTGSTGPTITAIDNAASYAAGVLAPSSYADIFGTSLASAASDPSLSVTLTDARGNQSAATILYAGSSQVNILIPSTAAYGAATLTLTNSLGSVSSNLTIGAIAPGLFTVDSAATMPAAQVVSTVNGVQIVSAVANCTSAGCTLVPIVLNSSTPSYLILYGTGIRGAPSLMDFSATIGGIPASVQYAGAQGGYPGLDQVNILIPSSLAGRGQVSLNFAIFTTSANAILLDFQ